MAISWYKVRIGMLYQEIATPLRARNDMVTFGWSHLVWLCKLQGYARSNCRLERGFHIQPTFHCLFLRFLLLYL